MRIVQAALLLAVVGSAQALTTAPFGVKKAFPTPVFMAEDAETTLAPTSNASSSGMEMKDVRKTVDELTKENFSESLSKIEPFLLNDAGASIYAKSMRRIATRAKALGVSVPEGYALEAKATQKKREKQDAFVKTKEEESAVAAAVEEETADEETAEETVEEEVAEPVVA